MPPPERIRRGNTSASFSPSARRQLLPQQQVRQRPAALGSLAQAVGSIEVTVSTVKLDGFDPNRLQNAVLGPMDEADVDVSTE